MFEGLKGLIWGSPAEHPKGNGGALAAPACKNLAEQNPLNEMQILEGHENFVTQMVIVDEARLATADTTGTIIVWDRNTGELLHRLKGHTLQINCMLIIQRNLISGSTDKTIRIWDLSHRGGAEIPCKILETHSKGVQSLVSISMNSFCSGGHDRYLALWSNQGELQGKIERQEDENLHCMLAISQGRLVTGSNSSLLLVYSTEKMAVQTMLPYHRDSIRALVKISSRLGAPLFASASLDGAVVIWNEDTLTPLSKFLHAETFLSEKKTLLSVNCLLALGEQYLAAAIGHSFKVFDITSNEIVLDCRHAHEADVKSVILLYEGTRIVSCSADSSIKLWGVTDPEFNFRAPKAKVRGKKTRLEPVLLGEMWGHTASVNSLLSLTWQSFASCSNDNTVVLWKDGSVESEHRNVCAAAILNHHTSQASDEFSEPEFQANCFDLSNSLQTPNLNLLQDLGIQIVDDYSPQTQKMDNQSLATMAENVRVPEYLFTYAEHLRKEQKMSIEKISEKLREEGSHSESIIGTIAQRQRVAQEQGN